MFCKNKSALMRFTPLAQKLFGKSNNPVQVLRLYESPQVRGEPLNLAEIITVEGGKQIVNTSWLGAL